MLTKLHYNLERMTGIEPAWLAWKARALPLSYIRKTSPSANAMTISTHYITLFHLFQEKRQISSLNHLIHICYFFATYMIKIHRTKRKLSLAVLARFILRLPHYLCQ